MQQKHSHIIELKDQLSKKEYALVEAQFRYDSIPTRKALTESKFRIKLAFLIPLVPAFVLLLIMVIKQIPTYNEGPNSRLAFVFLLILLIIAGGIIIWLITQVRKDISLLFGIHAKFAAGGYRNYHDEEAHTRDKIVVLTDEIIQLKKDIKEAVSERSYEDIQKEKDAKEFLEKDPSEMSEEDFYYYALGSWGEDKATINIKYKYGAYEEEKKEIEKAIREYKRQIGFIEQDRVNIDMRYQKSEVTFLYYMIGLFLIILVEYEFGSNSIVSILCGAAALIEFVIFLIFFFGRYKEASIYYKVEHNYHKVKYYAEEHRIIPTKMQKQEIYYKIKEKERRLSFVEQILNFPFESLKNKKEGM